MLRFFGIGYSSPTLATAMSDLIPAFTKYTPFVFLYRFLFETSRNFTDYAMILFLPSGMLRDFTDCATMLVLTSRMLRDFTNYTTMSVKHFEVVKQRSHANK